MEPKQPFVSLDPVVRQHKSVQKRHQNRSKSAALSIDTKLEGVYDPALQRSALREVKKTPKTDARTGTLERPQSAKSRQPARPKAPRSKSVPPHRVDKVYTPRKKDLWFVDEKIDEVKQEYQAKFARVGLEDAYQRKMAKLQKTREKELIGKSFKKIKQKHDAKMQSGIEGIFLGLSEKITNPEVCSIAEDVMMLTYDLVRSTSVLDYVMSAISFAKKRSNGKPLHTAFRNSLAKFVGSVLTTSDLLSMQAGLEKNLESARDALKMWPRVKASPLWRKINTVVVYATSFTLFGDNVTRSKALRIEDSFYKSRTLYQADFAYNVLDLLLFVAERGAQVVKTRRVDPMFHSGGAYESWYDRASELIAKSQFLCNPKAHGIDIHSFTATLDDLIAKGQSMYKFSCELDKVAKGVIRGTVNQLLTVRASYLNRKVAQQTRRAPLALVLEGHSSVGKTTFANVLHYYYGFLMGKNVEAGMRYTRMSAADFWDGFTSDMWSLLIDDAGSINPNVLQGIDPSIREILLAVNNAPFIPDMAKLEDKGAAPFLCELVVITTNTPDLNYEHCFNVPGAAARRTPFHVRIRPKLHLRKNATMIDETKLPTIEPGVYPDWWDIEILVPKLIAMSEDPALEFKQTFELLPLCKFSSMKEFLLWYRDVIEKHVSVQDRMATSEQSFRTTSLCEVCKLPTGMCGCPTQGSSTPSVLDIVADFVGSEEEEKSGEDPDMQAGFEYFNFTREGPPVSTEEIAYWGSNLRTVILFAVTRALVGSMFVMNSLLTLSVFCYLWNYRNFFIMMMARPTGWEGAAVLLRAMINRTYFALYDYMVGRVELVTDTTWQYSADAAAALRECGRRVELTYFAQSRLVQMIIVVLTIALAGFGAYKLFGRESYKMQGNVLDSVGRSPVPGTEPVNAWAKDVYTPSLLDLGRRTISWKNMSDEQISHTLGRNCGFIRFRSGDHWKVAKCFGLGGQFFLTTNHSVPAFEGRIDCQLVRSGYVTGPNGNLNFRLSKSDMIVDKDKDLLIFKCASVPPMRNVTDMFVRERLTNFRANGHYLGRGTDGKIFYRPITGIHEEEYYNPELRARTRVWWAKSSVVTDYGDCGSLMIGKSGSGPILLGIHQLGSSNGTVGAIKASYEDIMRMLNGALVVDDSGPMLDAESTNVGIPTTLHPKSPINFLPEGTVDCFGSFEGFRAEPKFCVETSILAPQLREYGYEDTHAAPEAKGWKPKYATLEDLVKIDPRVCTDTVTEAVRAFGKDLEKVPAKWKKEIMIYDIHTAVNGVPGLQYVDGLKRNTSAGFPYLKPKQYYLEQLTPCDDYPDHVKLTPEIETRIEEMIVKYQNNSRAGPVFRAAFKNEPLPIEKVKVGKVRTFMMASVEMTVVMRMYLLSFVRVAQSNHFLFECAPGIEAQSCEWDFLYQYLTQFGEERTIFGDFRGYDRSMHPVFINGAFEIMANFVEFCSGDKAHANIIRCLGYDVSFAYVDFFGDLLLLFGKNPSGQALTAIVNGLVNSLYMRYVHIHCSPARECVSFKENVALITYGDDNGMGVAKHAPFFTHTSIRDILADIGVEYTMADKTSESVPYIHISQGSFLKRAWKRFDVTNTMVAPLELASISKMLMVRVPSKVVSAEVQAVDTIRSANSEFFWHGQEVFEEKRTMLCVIMKNLGLTDLMHPPLEDWDTLLKRYIEASKAFLKRTDIPPYVNTSHYRFMDMESGRECRCGQMCDLANVLHTRECAVCHFLRFDDLDLACYHCGRQDRCPACGSALRQDVIFDYCGENVCERCFDDFTGGARCETCGLGGCQRSKRDEGVTYQLCPHCGRCEITDEYPDVRCGYCYDDGDPSHPTWNVGDGGPSSSNANQITPTVSTPPSSPFSGDEVYASGLDARTPVFFPTIEVLGRHNRENHPVPRAGNDDGEQQSTENTQEFHLQSGMESGATPNTGSDVMAAHPSATEQLQTAMFVDSGRGDTLDFAAANENLFTYDKQSNANLGDFLSRPRLISTITWTPGVLSDSTLDPWSLYLSTTEIAYKLNNFAYLRGNMKVKVVVNAANFYYGALMMYYTPLPNSVMPLSSTTGVKLQQSQRPHIWILPQKNEGGEMTLPFIYPKNYVAVTSATDVATLGRLSFTAFTQLSSANGATSNGVQIQVYAWMENVTLFGPTVGLAMQAGDEYGNGPVSAPAAAVAHWATYMSRVPIIGRLAKATGIGASAISQMAKIFGWSNVPVIEDVKPFKNVPFHDLASAQISEPTTKFMLDPKGELSVDPRIVGIGPEDELSVSHLVQKESYLATGTWTAGGAAGALIFSASVHPMLSERGTPSANGTYAIATTPMGWVGSAFGHWRGDVIFRFKVVCSQYHSGRLRIHWDPVSTLTGTTDYTHVAYTAILDIQESDEIEFRVPYMQALPWLACPLISATPTWSTSAVIAPVTATNGALTVRVLNNLTAPTDTASCSVLVFVRGAENLEFANPRDIPNTYTIFGMQSGVEPIQSNTPFDERYLVNWGEPVPSVRLLLRRSSLVDRITIPAITSTDLAGMIRVYQTRFPPMPGYDTTAYTAAKGVETPATTYKFSFTNTTYLGWFATAFIAMRGSSRWHYNLVNPDGAIPHNIAVTRRVGSTITAGNQGLESAYITGASSAMTTQSLLKGNVWKSYGTTFGASGLALTNPLTQTGVSVEYPMMTNYVFQFANPRNWLTGTSTDGSDTDTYTVDVNLHPSAGTGFSRMSLHRYAAAGTDFNLHFFLNTPVINFNSGAGSVPA